jgi:hypothetical protein
MPPFNPSLKLKLFPDWLLGFPSIPPYHVGNGFWRHLLLIFYQRSAQRRRGRATDDDVTFYDVERMQASKVWKYKITGLGCVDPIYFSSNIWILSAPNHNILTTTTSLCHGTMHISAKHSTNNDSSDQIHIERAHIIIFLDYDFTLFGTHFHMHTPHTDEFTTLLSVDIEIDCPSHNT